MILCLSRDITKVPRTSHPTRPHPTYLTKQSTDLPPRDIIGYARDSPHRDLRRSTRRGTIRDRSRSPDRRASSTLRHLHRHSIPVQHGNTQSNWKATFMRCGWCKQTGIALIPMQEDGQSLAKHHPPHSSTSWCRGQETAYLVTPPESVHIPTHSPPPPMQVRPPGKLPLPRKEHHPLKVRPPEGY